MKIVLKGVEEAVDKVDNSEKTAEYHKMHVEELLGNLWIKKLDSQRKTKALRTNRP
jgi:hypothetical protein